MTAEGRPGRLFLRVFLAGPGLVFRPEDYDKQCSFCLRDMAELSYLVKGPGVSVCSRCITRCTDELRRHRAGGWRPRWWDLRRRPEAPPRSLPYRDGDALCSFCGDGDDKSLLCAEHARICGTCVGLTVDILTEAEWQRE